MEHQIKDQNGAVVISFEGDVDLQSSPNAREVLLECVNRNRPLLVDLSRVNYIGSSGVASLVEALQNARKRGSELVLVAVSESAMRVFKLARLETVFTIFETLDEALAKTGKSTMLRAFPYQRSLIMTPRDGLPRFSALSARCGDAGHRKAWATTSESLGQPPFGSRMRPVGGRRNALTMHRIAGGLSPTRRTAYAISMNHYQ